MPACCIQILLRLWELLNHGQVCQICSAVKSSLLDGPISRSQLTTEDLHGAISQKTAFFIVTAVKTSNLTYSRMFTEETI
jgi:hypothetical protein